MQISRNIVSITLATGIGIFTGIKIFDPAFRELQVEKLEKKMVKQGEEGDVRFVGEEREQEEEAEEEEEEKKKKKMGVREGGA